MALGHYESVNGVARKVTKAYDSVNGVARNRIKAYDGVNGVARLFFAPANNEPVILQVEKSPQTPMRAKQLMKVKNLSCWISTLRLAARSMLHMAV